MSEKSIVILGKAGEAAWLTPYLKKMCSLSATLLGLEQVNVKQKPDLLMEEASLWSL